MADNKFTGKYYDGTFAGGEGPVAGQTVSTEKENTGLLAGGEGGGKKLTQNSGPTTITPPTPSGDQLFSLHAKPYEGPQNWIPRDAGVTNPFDINKG